MKKKIWNQFQFRIIVLFSVLSLFALLVSAKAGNTSLEKAEEQLLNAQQNNLKMLVKQYDTNLVTTENYIQTLLYGNNIYAALGSKETSTLYQQSRIWLRDELDDKLKVLSLISGFYVHIPQNEDCFLVKKTKNISLELGEHIKEQVLQKNKCLEPWIVKWNGENYLMYAWTNYVVEIGVVIRLNDMYELLRDSMEQNETLVFSYENENNIFLNKNENERILLSNHKILEESFGVLKAKIKLLIPKSVLNEKVMTGHRLAVSIAVIALVLIPILWCVIYKWFIIPMKQLSLSMQEILSGNMEYRIKNFSKLWEFRRIEETFNKVLNSNQNLKIQTYELKLEKEKEQFINLKLQINPHLLLNSLATIASLAINKKTEEIQEFAINLSKYFRYALRDTSDTVTIRSEIEFIKTYNRMQKIRYPNAFYLLFDVDEELMEEEIPPLLIQNFVENSIKYALKPGEEIEILVIIRRKDKKLRISICDNGRGMDESLREKISNGEIIKDSRGTHIGIKNCMNRLRTFYGDQAQLKINSAKNSGTQIWIEIPSAEEENIK